MGVLARRLILARLRTPVEQSEDDRAEVERVAPVDVLLAVDLVLRLVLVEHLTLGTETYTNMLMALARSEHHRSDESNREHD